jgi:hypothetical protein
MCVPVCPQLRASTVREALGELEDRYKALGFVCKVPV